MSYPALQDFEVDPGVTDAREGTARLKVYTHLRRHVLKFYEHRPVKHWAVIRSLHMRPEAAVAALDWLVREGYVIERPRPHRKATRMCVLAYDRTRTASKVTNGSTSVA